MKNYQVAKIANAPRVELKEALNLTGCEVSINELSANVSVPFVHAHKQNEELYIITDGDGELFIDGEVIKVSKGDAVRIDPDGKRCFRAGKNGVNLSKNGFKTRRLLKKQRVKRRRKSHL